ncbi:MAG TPA: DUF4446 family protein [Candidatus Saccharimonadales bacterium]|nr:DUF4446 family protein [Candidatus Saccharimonadales bacterium]
MDPLIIIFGTVILIWLGILTFLFVRIFGHYRRLLKGVNEGNLEKVLEKILERQELNKSEIDKISSKVAFLVREEKLHIQKVGMVRFNPFNEMGGDSSFALSLLNGNMDGVVVTGLHTREKTRVYAKKIERGESKYELSKDERKAINEAK